MSMKKLLSLMLALCLLCSLAACHKTASDEELFPQQSESGEDSPNPSQEDGKENKEDNFTEVIKDTVTDGTLPTANNGTEIELPQPVEPTEAVASQDPQPSQNGQTDVTEASTEESTAESTAESSETDTTPPWTGGVELPPDDFT